MKVVDVTSVSVLGHYRLMLGFNDGSERLVDLEGWLSGPIFEPLEDPEYFAQVRVELGTVAWPNGADLDPLVLHGDFPPAKTHPSGRQSLTIEFNSQPEARKPSG